MTATVAPRRPKASNGAADRRPRVAPRSVVEEIAARRRADIEAAFLTEGQGGGAVADAPPPRGFIDRFLGPGLHLIAEIKRSSPSAGRIAVTGEDIVARARAYQAGGAAAISVLCEPHWFGGSIEDLRAVRAAVSIPVLAKEFVVDDRQLEQLRAAGADAVLILAVLHPSKRRLRALVDAALALGLEPLVEAHDERELRLALETDARLIGLNNRDLRTLAVDPDRAGRLLALVPDDRLVIAESGVRDIDTIARWRAQGFDGALVGEALMRSPDPAAAARAFVAAGAVPADPANIARRPFVKICGVGDIGSAVAATSARPDALGLNLVPGTPRELSIDQAAEIARTVRGLTAGDSRPRLVAITADASAETLAAIVEAVDPDAIQLSGDEPVAAVAAVGRPVWKVLHLPAEPPADVDSRRVAARRARAGVPRGRRRAAAPRHGRRPASGRHGPARLDRPGRRGRPGPPGHPGRRPHAGQCRRGAARHPRGRRRRRVGRRVPARNAGGARSRTRISSRSSSSVPGRHATTVRTRRSARHRWRPASSTPTAPGAGGWSATSGAATSPRP